MVVLGALLLLVLFSWPRLGGKADTPIAVAEPRPPALADTNSGIPFETAKPPSEPANSDTTSSAVSTNRYEELESARYYREFPDLPLAFYGLVLDQDSNVLQNVTIDVVVTQWDTNAPPGAALKIAYAQGKSGLDGRFLIDSLSGHTVTVTGLTKDGYEPELIRPHYGEFRPRAGSSYEPVVYRMWSTNLHEPLISGDRDFKVVPDGRHYAVDLAKGSIAEGEDGDLVVWIKRPELAPPPQKYACPCGLAAPGGGLEPENTPGSTMYRAPVGDYTNVFNSYVDYNSHAQDGANLDNRFYVRLRNGQYGRVSADFRATYHYFAPTYRKDPAFAQIHLIYAINPSGSRLLR
jgi:hypothetical protein